MKKFFQILFVRLRFILVFVVVGLVVGNWSRITNLVDRYTRPHAEDVASGDFEWFCPMHPTVVRNDPDAKCPICGMPLSKRKKAEKAALPEGILGRLQLSPYRVRQAGVASEEAKPRALVREIRTVGRIEWDERRYSDLAARVAGRADELFVNFTGVRIQKGDPLYRLYSPDLVSTQEEYLLALKGLEDAQSAGGEAIGRARRLVESSRERLRLWGIAESQLAELESAKKAHTHLTISSPSSGIVVKKDIHAGHQVNVGDDPYTLVDDSVMWMQAEVFEKDLALVREGLKVEITSEAFPGRSFEGTVAFVAPQVSPETRTVKVRVDVPNPDRILKSGLYVTAMLRIPIGEVLAVPVGAVIDTGVRSVVFVDKGAGTFDAVEVVPGPKAGDYVQILKGVSAGDRVVSAGTFLLDAEARLNPAAGSVYFGASK
jgi:membrane fusion protein, copper/silver efflux system